MLRRLRHSTQARLAMTCLVVALISPLGLGLVGIARPAAAHQGENDDPLAATSLTVNVEFILDSSGSMAEPLPGAENQTRMDAAKLAMREVIDRIPDRDGLNVGFRVYGHEGSNSEADRALSCRSTELLVPIDGVDAEALLAQVEAARPTGWTPLAGSLAAAAEDFAPGGESVTNAVIMVTDGEDTCGGDPCAIAGQLHAAEVSLTTHVVGFALSPEQQEAVGCIAAEGGGALYTADDADSLSEAVFSALTRVESTPVPAEVATVTDVGGYVGGNAFAFLDDGVAGELSVVAIGAYDGSHLPVVVRNSTGDDVQDIQVVAIARSGGDLVATGADQGLHSRVVEDGGVAFGDVYFGEDLPDDAEFEFELSAAPAEEADASSLDLVVAEIDGDGAGVVGILANAHDVPVGDPTITVSVACFDDAGRLLDVGFTPAMKSLVEPGATTPFEVGVPDAGAALETEICPVFLVAGDGNNWDS